MQRIQLSVALLATLVLLGCGGPQGLPTHYVEGMVTLDGQPLSGALVTFTPATPGEDTRSAVGYSDESGKYTLTSEGGAPQRGALEGDYVVTIMKQHVESTAPQSSSDSDPGDSSAARRTMVTPQVYASATTSPLKATVRRGNNDIPFNLENR